MGGLVSRLVRWASSSVPLRLVGPGDSKSQVMAALPTSVLIFTQNIARHPIAWDPARQRPTQELVHAVHSALHFALDPCVDHPNEALSFTVQDGVLVIPNKADLMKQPERIGSGWEVNVKLFIRAAQQDPVGYVRIFERALAGLRDSVGATLLESFVVSLDAICWNGEKEDEECGLQDVDKLGDLWAHMSSHAEISNIGVSDFSASHLRRLLALVEARNSSGESAKPLRKPTIDQMNISPNASEPTALLDLTKQGGIHLQTHVDDLGTTKQMVGLLSEFEDRLPLSDSFKKLRDEERYDEALGMEWVLKYTVFNKDRGIVGEKGYIVSAKLAM
ncbi:hypothetical protein RhiJN_17579 [Ceratobasidium sp. AG-Ba]|nr:hypothetical protein RhiJN_17579 [Ceratobasidium sp. AG-Ba]